jgi:hypothetical protein
MKGKDLSKIQMSNLAFSKSAFYIKMTMLAKRARNFNHLYYEREPNFIIRKNNDSFKAGSRSPNKGKYKNSSMKSKFLDHKGINATRRPTFVGLGATISPRGGFSKKPTSILGSSSVFRQQSKRTDGNASFENDESI